MSVNPKKGLSYYFFPWPFGAMRQDLRRIYKDKDITLDDLWPVIERTCPGENKENYRMATWFEPVLERRISLEGLVQWVKIVELPWIYGGLRNCSKRAFEDHSFIKTVENMKVKVGYWIFYPDGTSKGHSNFYKFYGPCSPSINEIWPILKENGFNGRKKNYRLTARGPDRILESNLEMGKIVEWGAIATINYRTEEYTPKDSIFDEWVINNSQDVDNEELNNG